MEVTAWAALVITSAVSGAVCRKCGEITVGEKAKTCDHCGSRRVEFKGHALPENLQRFGCHDCRHHFISY